MHIIAKAISPDRSIGEILEFTGGDSRRLSLQSSSSLRQPVVRSPGLWPAATPSGSIKPTCQDSETGQRPDGLNQGRRMQKPVLESLRIMPNGARRRRGSCRWLPVGAAAPSSPAKRSEEHTSELQSHLHL